MTENLPPRRSTCRPAGWLACHSPSSPGDIRRGAAVGLGMAWAGLILNGLVWVFWIVTWIVGMAG